MSAQSVRSLSDDTTMNEGIASRVHGHFGPLVGRSAAMLGIFRILKRLAQSTTTVLIEGEIGTGKSATARAIHDQGPRRHGPFVTVDCAALLPGEVQGALFGGGLRAFGGTAGRHVGGVEASSGGTLFLDELDDLPVELQPKLLPVLEGPDRGRPAEELPPSVDTRVIVSTRRSLSDQLKAGRIHADLYYRIAVIPIHLPPLRKRPEDIAPLVHHMVRDVLQGDSVKAEELLGRTNDAWWRRLESRRWPGNLRELRDLVERMVVFGRVGGDTADLRCLTR